MDILFPGRFSILTEVHESIIRHISDKYAAEGKVYIGLRVIVNENWTNYDNPFTFYERKEMFNLVFGDEISSGKIYVVPLSYNPLYLYKDMKVYCGGKIPVYTREKIWKYCCKFLSMKVIYENRTGMSATNIKEKIYEILRKKQKLPAHIDGIDDKILNFINNEEITNRLKNFAKNPNRDKFGIKRLLKNG